MQDYMQKHETAAIADCDRVSFAGGPKGNTSADTRSHTEHNSITNTDGADADTITSLGVDTTKAETSSQRCFGCSFRFNGSTLQLSNNSQLFRMMLLSRFAFTYLV